MNKEFLHKKSLVLARMFRESYNKLGPDHRMTELLFERYKETRRKIPKDSNGRRLGAHEAYVETQD